MSATTDHGTDIAGFAYLSPLFGLASGRVNLANALARRLTTPAGTLDDHPEYGYDIRQFLNDDFTPTKAAAVRASVKAQCELDERVQSVRVDFSIVQGIATLRLSVEDDDGPFDLVLRVDGVSAALLEVDGQTLVVVDTAITSSTTVVGIQGPQGIPGPPGPPGTGGGGGGSSSVEIDEQGPFADSSGTEKLAYQAVFDFGVLGGSLIAAFAAMVKTASGTATFRLRIGGTPDNADGTVVATLTTTSSTFVKAGQSSGAFANPSGLQLVTVTLQGPSSGVDVEIQGIVASVR